MEFLSQKGVAFVAKDVSVDIAARQELIALGSRATPTIKVGEEVMIGFNPGKLAQLLGI